MAELLHHLECKKNLQTMGFQLYLSLKSLQIMGFQLSLSLNWFFKRRISELNHPTVPYQAFLPSAFSPPPGHHPPPAPSGSGSRRDGWHRYVDGAFRYQFGGSVSSLGWWSHSREMDSDGWKKKDELKWGIFILQRLIWFVEMIVLYILTYILYITTFLKLYCSGYVTCVLVGCIICY